MCATSSLIVSCSHSRNNVLFNPTYFDCVFRYLKPSQSALAASVNRYFQSQIHNKLFANQLGIPFSSTETCTDVYTRALMLVGRIGLSPFINPFLNLEKVVYGIAPLCLPESIPSHTREGYLELRAPIRPNSITRAILTDFSSESSILSRTIEILLMTESPNLQTLKYAALLTTSSICQQIFKDAPQSADRLSAILREVVWSLPFCPGAPRTPKYINNNKNDIIDFLLAHEAVPIDHNAVLNREERFHIFYFYYYLNKKKFQIDRVKFLPEENSAMLKWRDSIYQRDHLPGFARSRSTALRLTLAFCNSKVYRDGNLVIGEQEREKNLFLMAYDRQSQECRWGRLLGKDVRWQMTAAGIAWINSSTGVCYLLNPQTGQICSTGAIELEGWSESQRDNDIHITSSGIGYYFKGEFFCGLRQIGNKISPTFVEPRPPGKFIPLGPYVAFCEPSQDKCYIFNAEGRKYVLPNIVSIKAANGNIYMVDKPIEKGQPSVLFVIPEEDFLFITDTAQIELPQIKAPSGYTQIKEVFDDGTVLCFNTTVSNEEVLYFIHVDKKETIHIPHISRSNEICIDKKFKRIWCWDKYSDYLYRINAMGEREEIGSAFVSKSSEILYIDYEENESPLVYFTSKDNDK